METSSKQSGIQKNPQDLCLRLGLTKREHADPASLTWSTAALQFDNGFTQQATEDIHKPNGRRRAVARGTADTLRGLAQLTFLQYTEHFWGFQLRGPAVNSLACFFFFLFTLGYLKLRLANPKALNIPRLTLHLSHLLLQWAGYTAMLFLPRWLPSLTPFQISTVKLSLLDVTASLLTRVPVECRGVPDSRAACARVDGTIGRSGQVAASAGEGQHTEQTCAMPPTASQSSGTDTSWPDFYAENVQRIFLPKKTKTQTPWY